MAGKRQHYVPRLLQRDFLDDPSDEAERTWLHRRGADAWLVSIRDVGVEDRFYSRKSPDGMPTLDDAITDLERDLAACYGPDGAINFEVVTSLSPHVERLFWSLGIDCWPDDYDVRCLVTDQFFFPPQLP